MHHDTTAGTSRRTFLATGLLSTAGLVGLSSADPDGESDSNVERTPAEDADGGLERGVMRPYQHTPERRVTVETALDWAPQRLDGPHRAYVVTYDRAPSFRAHLFTNTDDAGDAGDGRNGGRHALEVGDSLALGSVRDSPSSSSHRFVTVGLERVERDE